MCGLKTTQRRILILGILIFVLENEIKKKKYSNENCILNTLYLFFLFAKYIFHLESREMRFFFFFFLFYNKDNHNKSTKPKKLILFYVHAKKDKITPASDLHRVSAGSWAHLGPAGM